jgi:hypothetical protein
MIYFTGFQNWDKQFGELISIANSEPAGFKGRVKRLYFFVPDWTAVNLWKGSYKTEQDWEEFVTVYRVLCRKRWDTIARWLETLTPEVDMTLLCWERKSLNCHRLLVSKIVKHYRPDCYGGLDVQNPYRKRFSYCDTQYDILVVNCPWCEGFSFSLSDVGGIYRIGDRSDYPFVRGIYALPEYAIDAAISFVKADAFE